MSSYHASLLITECTHGCGLAALSMYQGSQTGVSAMLYF